MTSQSSVERPRHLNVALDDDLRGLKERVRLMGQLVDERVAASVKAFLDRDVPAATAIVVGDRAVNDLEREIDGHCVRILALFQPVASDLRFVAAVLKIVTDLERIGDFAVNIAKSVDRLRPDKLDLEQALPQLVGGALEVLRRALGTFLVRDATDAERAAKGDVPVTASAMLLAAQLRDAIQRDPASLETAVAMLFVAKYIERIAEHATNIAEMALYTERGEDVRHQLP